MLSIPLRLAVSMLVLVMVPSLGLLVGHRRRSTSESKVEKVEAVAPRPPFATPAPAEPAPPPSGLAVGPPRRCPACPERDVYPTLPTNPTPTSHARLILDGYFAERIGLLSALRELDLPGKTVRHTPQEHLVAALVNVLAGHRQLQEISRGDNPLRTDLALAQAWGQVQFPEVSGVCRQLRQADWAQAQALREQLGQVFAPYIVKCVGPSLARQERLVVDWDLTPKQITTEAHSDPFAAYGHMGDEIGKGYQWAEAVLRGRGATGPRPVALGGFLCPGSAHPDGCLERLRLVTEAALGRPRRRPELLRIRLAGVQAREQARLGEVTTLQARLSGQESRVQTRLAQLQAIKERRERRHPEQQALLARDERAEQRAEKSLAAAQKRLEAGGRHLSEAERTLVQARELTSKLEQRLARLEADNALLEQTHQPPTPIEVVVDSQFGGSEMIAELREEGYEVTTKAISPATMAGLLRREKQGEKLFGVWKSVSANAEVAECLETSYALCPYALRLLGYRKHLAASGSRPAKTRYALFLTSIPLQERGCEETVQHYHVRGGTAELLNRQAKSNLGFRGHRLRHAPGLDVLGQLVFAGLNFVPWLADTLWSQCDAEAGERPGLAELTQMARAPAQVLRDEEGVAVQFAQDSGWPQRTLHLGALLQPPLPGFVWPGVPINPQMVLQNSNRDLVARKLG
jgi:hypothetical protein